MGGKSSKNSTEHRLRENLLLTLDMFESGITLMRESLQRKHPKLSDDEIEQKITQWLRNRPPDGPGEFVKWPLDSKPKE